MGLKQVGTSLRSMDGKRLRHGLSYLASSPTLGFLSGLAVTGLSNSLTLVSVLLVQFVSAGLLSFEQCVPVLMGAGVGSTLIGLLVVLNVTKLGLPMFGVAFIAEFWMGGDPQGRTFCGVTSEVRQHILRIVGGLGLLFHGSELMGHAFAFLHEATGQDSIVMNVITSLESPILGFFVGTAFTAVVQSSGAALGVYLSLAKEGVLSARTGIGLVLGANVGTCVTAVLAAFGQGTGPMRVATALTVARLVGGLMCCCCVGLLQQVAEVACGLALGASSDAGAPPEHHAAVIAAAHTIFNVFLAMLVVPVAAKYSLCISWLVKDGSVEQGKKVDIIGV